MRAKDYNVLDFGAVGDGVTDDTQAIRAAVGQCSELGGRVVLDGGRIYRCGAV